MMGGNAEAHSAVRAEPLVTIAIPTYNRAELLPRSLSSAMSQTYRNLEIVVSDNASTDATFEVVHDAMQRDGRVHYVRAERNAGAAQNFVKALSHATGDYFMWLGDDDWIDENCIETAVQRLSDDADVVLVGCRELYYRRGVVSHQGRLLNLHSDSVWRRLVSYHWQVRDNGIFYGVMRTTALREARPALLMTKFAGDQLLVAALAARGKIAVHSDAAIHRELGGASSSYRAVAAAAGRSKLFALFPFLSVAVGAFLETIRDPHLKRSEAVLLAPLVFSAVVARSFSVYGSAASRRLKRGFAIRERHR